MRSKYGEYPEYHTSLDNLEVISPSGLSGALEMLKSAVIILETNDFWKVNVLCEPQLGKRGLYPNVSTKTSNSKIRNQMNVISYFDGNTDLLQIADKCKISYHEVLEVVEELKNYGLINKVVRSKSD
jgi:aminopeptidase-like protein